MGIIHIFCNDWIDCRGASTVVLRNGLNIVEAKCNGHFTFESVIESWGAYSDDTLTTVNLNYVTLVNYIKFVYGEVKYAYYKGNPTYLLT